VAQSTRETEFEYSARVSGTAGDDSTPADSFFNKR